MQRNLVAALGELGAEEVGNASSASFVSWRQTTSGLRSSSHGSSRGTRCLTEFTFQVAIRTLRDRTDSP